MFNDVHEFSTNLVGLVEILQPCPTCNYELVFTLDGVVLSLIYHAPIPLAQHVITWLVWNLSSLYNKGLVSRSLSETRHFTRNKIILLKRAKTRSQHTSRYWIRRAPIGVKQVTTSGRGHAEKPVIGRLGSGHGI